MFKNVYVLLIDAKTYISKLSPDQKASYTHLQTLPFCTYTVLLTIGAVLGDAQNF